MRGAPPLMCAALALALCCSGCRKRAPSASPSAQPSGAATEEAEPAPETDEENHEVAPAPPPGAEQPAAEPKGAAPRKRGSAKQPWLLPWLARAGVQLPSSLSPTPRLVSRRRGSKATAALRLGRAGLFLYDRLLLPSRCRTAGGACGRERGAGEQITLRPRDLGAPTAEGPRLIPRLAKACRHLKGREVLLLVDRDVLVGTLRQLVATLHEVGAVPQLGALGADGVVALWPADAPEDTRLRPRDLPGERLPADLQGLTVELTADRATAVLQRAGGGYMRRPLAEPPWSALARWAARLSNRAKPLRAALLVVDEQMTTRRLARAIEALMAPCRTARCLAPTRRMRTWQLVRLEVGGAAGEVDPPELPNNIMQPKQAAPQVKVASPLVRPRAVRPGRPAMRGHRVDLGARPALPQARLRAARGASALGDGGQP